MASSSNSAAVDRRVSALAPVSEVVERRSRLATTANPDARHDYVVSLTAELQIGGLGPAVSATLRYVPDRHVLQTPALASYVAAIEAMSWPSLETLATTVLADLNNELIPRWIHVRLATVGDDGAGIRHDVDIEDRQPSWDNERLIARLDTY